MPFGKIKDAVSGVTDSLGGLFDDPTSAVSLATNPFGWSTAGTAALTGGLDLFGTYLQNEANAKQADLNRKFQERMSNTAYQRAVQDMKAAGLNPLLAGVHHQPASTPGGAQAQMQNLFGGAVSSAMQGARLPSDIKRTKEQTRLMKQQARTSRQEEDLRIMDYHRGWTQSRANDAQAEYYKSLVKKTDQETKNLGHMESQREAEAAVYDAVGELIIGLREAFPWLAGAGALDVLRRKPKPTDKPKKSGNQSATSGKKKYSQMTPAERKAFRRRINRKHKNVNRQGAAP